LSPHSKTNKDQDSAHQENNQESDGLSKNIPIKQLNSVSVQKRRGQQSNVARPFQASL